MEGTDKTSYHRLDFDMRIEIAAGLDRHESIPAIASSLGVSPSTVRREILRNRSFMGPSSSVNKEKNDCAHNNDCDLRGLCRCAYTKMLCRRCPRPCHTFGCPQYEPRRCPVVSKAPFVCNACKRYPICTQPRWRYSAKSAQSSADARAKESRCGIDMTPQEMETLVEKVRDGLSKGQSVHHIFASRELPCSERSFYRHIEAEDFPIIALELPKKVKYKKRSHPGGRVHDSTFYAGRTYDDFMRLPEQVRAHAAQGDSVIGRQGDRKRIFSLHRPDLSFQLYFLAQDGTTAPIVAALDELERACIEPKTGERRFEELFGVILFDRGSEFDDIEGMERSCLDPGRKRCRVFFADPGRADQKASCEKNHVELRKILPKGTSMEALTVGQLKEICSHVNSTIRKGCGNTTPFGKAKCVFPQFMLDALGLREVPPEDVIATPGVLYDPSEEDGSKK